MEHTAAFTVEDDLVRLEDVLRSPLGAVQSMEWSSTNSGREDQTQETGGEHLDRGKEC